MAPLNKSSLISDLHAHAQHPSAYLATNRDTEVFQTNRAPGFIAYRIAGRRHVVIIAGISTDLEHKDILLTEFLNWAAAQNRNVIAIQMLQDDATILAKHGFQVNLVGSSYCLSLDNFSLKGKHFMKLRNKIAQARRAGLEIREFGRDLSYNSELDSQIKHIDSLWLKQKGGKSYSLLIAELGDLSQFNPSEERLFVALQGDTVVAYIFYTPSFGSYHGWMHDLTRRLPHAPTGVMELINSTAIEKFRSEKVGYLNFGFTPLAGLENGKEMEGYSSLLKNALSFFYRTNLLYPTDSQVIYKLKWMPNIVLPEYIAFQKNFSFVGLWHFLRLANAL